MLPGDFIAMRMTGDIVTTVSGLSEGIFWDFKNETVSEDLMNFFRIQQRSDTGDPADIRLTGRTAGLCRNGTGLGRKVLLLPTAGDQPNNALSLNVLNPGDAATGGTSGWCMA